MHVRSTRRQSFAVAPEVLWAAILDVDHYPAWWPWLKEFEADGLAAGETWRCLVQPPLLYSVRFTIHIQQVVPAAVVRATLTGDIEGTARIDLTRPRAGETAVRLVSDLAPSHLALKAIGLAAGPVVRLAHNWVLDTGARQFRERALPPSA